MDIDFKKAVYDYKDMVYKIAYAGCGNTHDADDIIQDVFFTLHRANKHFDSEEHLKAWLIKVTVNRVKSHLRSFHIRKNKPLDDTLSVSDCGGNVEDAIELELIREAVMSLPKDYRIAVILYYFCGYSSSEIAKILKTKEPTVRTRLKRAREKLRTELKEEICYDR